MLEEGAARVVGEAGDDQSVAIGRERDLGDRHLIEDVRDVHLHAELGAPLELEIVEDVQIRLVDHGRAAEIAATVEVHGNGLVGDGRRVDGAAHGEEVQAEVRSPLGGVGTLEFELERTVGVEQTVRLPALLVEGQVERVVVTADVGGGAARFIRARKTAVVAVQAAPQQARGRLPAIGVPLAEDELHAVIVVEDLGYLGVLGAERRLPDTVAGIGDVEDFADAGDGNAHVVDGLVPPLVRVAHADGHHRGEFVVHAQGELLLLGRLEVRIDQALSKLVRRVTTIVLLDEGAPGAGRAAVDVLAVDRGPVGHVRLVDVVDPVISAPGAARHLELHGVVEDAPRPVGLPLAVALDVVGEAEAGRDLVAPPELDPGILRLVGGNLLVLETQAVVHGELAVDRPLILHEEAQVGLLDVSSGVDPAGREVAVLAGRGAAAEGVA